MAFKVFFITAVVAVNLIFPDGATHAFNLPFLGGGNSSLELPSLGGGGNGSSGLPRLPGLPSLPGLREKRSPNHHQSNETEAQDRLFFGRFVSCNYTTQGGTTCSSCRQSLACYSNNIGRVRTCRGLLRYCNNGRCSFIPGAQCSSSSDSNSSDSSNSSSSNSTR